jgi:hypothetical protein
MRDGVKIRAAQESAERAEAEAAAAAEQIVRELAVVQRAIAEQREQREQDARRLGSAEEAARRTRMETTAAVEQMAGEMAALRRTLAERQDGVDAVEARLSAVEESARVARAEATTSVEQMTGELAALRGARDEAAASSTRLADEIGGLKRLVADLDARRTEDAARMSALETAASSGLSLEDSRAIAERAERDAIAAADAAVRAVRDEMLAAVAATREEVASLRGVVAAATAAVELQAGRDEDRERKLASVRGETAAALDALRAERADFARALEARVAEQDERARALDTRVTEQADLARALDARVTEQAELARALDARMAALPALPDEPASVGDLRARLDDLAVLTGRLEGEQHRLVAEMRGETEAGLAAVRAAASERDGAISELRARQDELVRALDERLAGAPTAPAGDEAFADVRARLDGLQTTTARLDAEQRRLAADVEERLRALMRTAAGGFDVQLALLRGKVEVLARSLRERVPVEPDAAGEDALLGHRHGLLDRLRDQLSALRSSAEWAPQRVVDLLLESTLAAAVTPFRRMLQLGDAGEGDAAPRASADAPPATDGSAAPSSDL